MQLPSISATAVFATQGDGFCGTKVPGHPPHVGPDTGPLASIKGLLDKVSLNPQPLPPGGGSVAFDDEFRCGNVPRGPFPPVPLQIGAQLR